MIEIDLRLILDNLRRGWLTPVVLAGIAVLVALVFLNSQPAVYRVEMLVLPAPASENPTGSTAAAGAIGSLLGISGGQQSSSDYIRYQRLLASPAVAERMQQKDNMLHYVFSGAWDEKNKKWIEPRTMRGALLGWLFKLAHVPIWTPPDVTALAAYVKAKVLVVPSTQNDIVVVSMNHPDVAFAQRVMLSAHTQANAVLRDQIARRARQQADYLQAKLAQTMVADYRATLLALLSAQEKTLMLTQTDASFAAEIVSQPVASPVPVSPRPLLSIAVALLVGILVGGMLVIFFGPDWWRKARALLLSAGARAAGPRHSPTHRHD